MYNAGCKSLSIPFRAPHAKAARNPRKACKAELVLQIRWENFYQYIKNGGKVRNSFLSTAILILITANIEP
jgi:hypothetical protein